MAHGKVIQVLRANLKRSLREKDFEQAAEVLARLEQEDPLSAETGTLKLELLVASQRWDEAATVAPHLCEKFPGSTDIQFHCGRIRYQQRDYRRAAEHFEEAGRIRPHWLNDLWLGKSCTQAGDFERAEALLVGLLPAHPQIALDLAWLYERRGQPERALRHVETYLEDSPHAAAAQQQRLRLRAQLLEPAALVREVETLGEYGEEIPAAMVPSYVKRLLETGDRDAARVFIERNEAQWSSRTTTSVAWECYKLQAHDLALRLFLRVLAEKADDPRTLNVVEAAARRCGREADVVARYAELAPDCKQLYGRIRRLQRRTSA